MTALSRSQTRPLILATLLAVSGATLGCDVGGTRGEGAIKSETRQTEAFTRIESGAGIHVSVGIGAASPLEVKAQANILPLIVTEVMDGTLRIRGSRSFTSSETVQVILTTPAVDRIVLTGSSRGTIDGLASDAFDAEVTGGSVLTATGTTESISLDASGGSVAQLDGLVATMVDVDISGGSRAEVRATDLVKGSATGGSRVTVAGGAMTTVDTNGGSQVERR